MPSWVIIGASRGIGYQYLKTLSRDPSNTVIGLVRTPEPTKEKLASDGIDNVHILHGDLTDSVSLYAAARDVGSLTDGVLDHLVVNGAYVAIPTLALTASQYVGAENESLLQSDVDLSMRTNATGVLFSINAFMPLILKSSVKKVICITSGAADTSTYEQCDQIGQLAYAMGKAALNVVVAKYAAEYKQKEVKFLALAPGFVNAFGGSVDQLPQPVQDIFGKFTKGFQKKYPHCQGPEGLEENMEKQLNVINNLSLEQSGQFLSQLGNKQWV